MHLNNKKIDIGIRIMKMNKNMDDFPFDKVGLDKAVKKQKAGFQR